MALCVLELVSLFAAHTAVMLPLVCLLLTATLEAPQASQAQRTTGSWSCAMNMVFTACSVSALHPQSSWWELGSHTCCSHVIHKDLAWDLSQGQSPWAEM